MSKITAFNSFSSLVFLGYTLIVPLYYLAQGIIYSREIKSLRNKLEYKRVLGEDADEEDVQVLDDKAKIIRNSFRAKTLFEEYHVDSPYQYMYPVFFLLSRLIYAYVLARSYNNQDYQLFIMSALSAASMAWLAMFRPYTAAGRNEIAIANEAAAFFLFS